MFYTNLGVGGWNERILKVETSLWLPHSQDGGERLDSTRFDFPFSRESCSLFSNLETTSSNNMQSVKTPLNPSCEPKMMAKMLDNCSSSLCPSPDAVINEAAQILRLLHIEELRELQTKINEAIVAVQAIIADPKTDHRLGKVGR